MQSSPRTTTGECRFWGARIYGRVFLRRRLDTLFTVAPCSAGGLEGFAFPVRGQFDRYDRHTPVGRCSKEDSGAHYGSGDFRLGGRGRGFVLRREPGGCGEAAGCCNRWSVVRGRCDRDRASRAYPVCNPCAKYEVAGAAALGGCWTFPVLVGVWHASWSGGSHDRQVVDHICSSSWSGCSRRHSCRGVHRWSVWTGPRHADDVGRRRFDRAHSAIGRGHQDYGEATVHCRSTGVATLVGGGCDHVCRGLHSVWIVWDMSAP